METDASELIQGLYGAAGSQARWSAVLSTYARHTGAMGATLVGHDTQTGLLLQAGSEELLPAFKRGVEFLRCNPYVPLAPTWPVGRLLLANDALPKSVATRTEFYNEFVAKERLQLQAVLIKLFPLPAHTAGLSVHFSADCSDDSIERTLPRHQALLGHVQAALRLHCRVRELEARSTELLHALDHNDSVVAICDARGRILALSQRAERLLAGADGLRTRQSCLVADEEHDHRALSRAIGRAASLSEERPGTPPDPLRVSRPSGRAPYEVLLSPVPRRHDSLRCVGGRVIVFIHDPDAIARSAADLLMRRFGLTRKEALVLELLQRGESTHVIGERLTVGMETVRSHLRSLFSKTSTRGQVQLVARTLRGLGQLRGRGE
jgi:DNA-binding CsgD family transcriptional regulator